jgi:hypothetical protein
MRLGIMELVPPRETLDSMLDALPNEPVDASLSLRSPLLPLSGLEDPPSAGEGNFDLEGYSSYARIISLLLDAFVVDRIVAKANLWVIRHFLALSIYAEDVLDLPKKPSEVFDANVVSHLALQQLARNVQQLTIYVLSSDVYDRKNWHENVTASCIDPKLQHNVGKFGKFVVGLFQALISNDNPRDARILHTVLQHILNHTSKEEGELWMGVCRKIETKGRKTHPLQHITLTNSS